MQTARASWSAWASAWWRAARTPGAVIVVEGADRIRAVLGPVYEALGIDWDPGTVGAVAEEIGLGGGSWSALCDALLDQYARLFEIEEAELDPETLELAQRLADDHRALSRLDPRRGKVRTAARRSGRLGLRSGRLGLRRGSLGVRHDGVDDLRPYPRGGRGPSPGSPPARRRGSRGPWPRRARNGTSGSSVPWITVVGTRSSASRSVRSPEAMIAASWRACRRGGGSGRRWPRRSREREPRPRGSRGADPLEHPHEVAHERLALGRRAAHQDAPHAQLRRPTRRSPVVDMIDVSESTRSGRSIAIVCAIIPPIDAPTTWARSMPRWSSRPNVSVAMSPSR